MMPFTLALFAWDAPKVAGADAAESAEQGICALEGKNTAGYAQFAAAVSIGIFIGPVYQLKDVRVGNYTAKCGLAAVAAFEMVTTAIFASFDLYCAKESAGGLWIKAFGQIGGALYAVYWAVTKAISTKAKEEAKKETELRAKLAEMEKEMELEQIAAPPSPQHTIPAAAITPYKDAGTSTGVEREEKIAGHVFVTRRVTSRHTDPNVE